MKKITKIEEIKKVETELKISKNVANTIKKFYLKKKVFVSIIAKKL